MKHFSHEEHRLIGIFEDEGVEHYEDHEGDHTCRICGLPILFSPSYTCSECKFFLHKPCAELPQSLNHPSHKPNPHKDHILHLVPSEKNFTYKCESCEFGIHPLALLPVEIKTRHISHQPHPLVAICRETLSLCNACGEEHRGFFFACQDCNFWIHQDCTLLPSFVKLPSHPHHLILAYSLPSVILYIADDCLVCKREVQVRYDGLYFCMECKKCFHVNCAKSEGLEILNRDIAKQLLIQLPDEGDTFPSLMIRRCVEARTPNLSMTQTHHNEEIHEHDLILDDGRTTQASLLCDVCTQPITISSPFYRSEQSESNFHAHIICASFPSTIDYLARQRFGGVLSFSPAQSHLVFNSVFSCFYCHRPSNGLCYYSESDVFMDLECAISPKIIKHASHSKHALFLDVKANASRTRFQLNCCLGESFGPDIYTCDGCNFHIHRRCALLPKRTHHKFDQHPLELITATSSRDVDGQEGEYSCFCEFCEQDIDQQYWYYGCSKCEQYFHIDCIPSVGHLSRIKFGKTLADKAIHDHPVALTRMLLVGRHEKCGYCHEVIEGFVDEMAFHCSQCDFWIHFSCARDSSTAQNQEKKMLYSEISEKIREYFKGLYLKVQVRGQ